MRNSCAGGDAMRFGNVRKRLLACALGLFLLLATLPAAADEYEEERAGHPLRIVAYVVHPIGVILDYVLLRPFHWIGSHEPFKTLFGHRD